MAQARPVTVRSKEARHVPSRPTPRRGRRRLDRHSVRLGAGAGERQPRQRAAARGAAGVGRRKHGRGNPRRQRSRGLRPDDQLRLVPPGRHRRRPADRAPRRSRRGRSHDRRPPQGPLGDQLRHLPNTDPKGNADLSFGTVDEGNYLFMVAQRSTSQPGGFRLSLFAPENREAYPGRHLPARGVTTTVDSLLDADDAWSTEMKAAHTYRITVSARSDVVLTLATGEQMQTDLALLDDRGRNIRCACLAGGGARMRLQLPRGRYFLAVRSREHTGGRYRLRLLVREITKTRITIDGRRRAFANPGRSVVVAAKVSPARAGGLVRFKVDRFDPFQGWVFARFLTAQVGADGVGRVAWIPPSVGRWRIDARFRGTIARSPSRSGTATLLVAEPL